MVDEDVLRFPFVPAVDVELEFRDGVADDRGAGHDRDGAVERGCNAGAGFEAGRTRGDEAGTGDVVLVGPGELHDLAGDERLHVVVGYEGGGVEGSGGGVAREGVLPGVAEIDGEDVLFHLFVPLCY